MEAREYYRSTGHGATVARGGQRADNAANRGGEGKRERVCVRARARACERGREAQREGEGQREGGR